MYSQTYNGKTIKDRSNRGEKHETRSNSFDSPEILLLTIEKPYELEKPLKPEIQKCDR